MQRVIRAVPNPSTSTYTVTNKPIYSRFHRKPQIYPTSFQVNRTYKVDDNIEQDNINNYISNMYKEKKFRGVLDPTSPNNKDIFIDTDSEPQKSEREGKFSLPIKKSAKLLIAKTESQFPQTYNAQTIFKRDGLTRGYYIKGNQPNNKINDNIYKTYSTLTTNNKIPKNVMQTPSPLIDNKAYQDYNQNSQSRMRSKQLTMNNLNQRNQRNGFFKKEMDLDEWPSGERNPVNTKYINFNNYSRPNNYESNNLNQYQTNAQRFPPNMVYSRGNLYEPYTKSNISDTSDDNNQYGIRPINDNNYIIEGNNSGIAIASPDYNNRNNIEGLSDEESDRQRDNYYFNENQKPRRIINEEIDNNVPDYQGGKVQLYYGINKNRGNNIRNKNIVIRKNKYLSPEYMIRNDEKKLNLLIKLQNAIRDYLLLRELSAMKIQAVWRGGNTRRIMDLYNDLDEFIYHLSKVQFNHFNDAFCFFINQLFNIYKANLSDRDINQNDDSENNNEEEMNDNENCFNQISLEDIENKGGNSDYIYKFPEGACFEPEKLAHENEIALYVEATNNPSQEKKGKKQYDRLKRDYEELCQKYNELIDNNNNEQNIQNNLRIIPKKEKNESESTFGSAKSDYKFHKLGSNSRDKKKLAYSDIKNEDIGKNSTFSNEYDADLDIKGGDDFFNGDISNDDNDNKGSLTKKRYSYSIHSDENSKYFDNERKEKDIKEGDTYKNNISKNSGGSKYNNSAKYTGYTSHKGSKLVGLHKYDKGSKEELSTSPFIERSNNYIGHHSKTFPRKYKNDNDSVNVNNNLITHEDDFIIMNQNLLLLSPKDKDENKNRHKKLRSDIAKTPNIKFEDKNWNEIIEYIKNEEIEIPTQKRPKTESVINEKDDKANKIFDVLEKEKNEEIFIDNDDYRKKKLSQIYVEHENEIKIENVERKKKKSNQIEKGNELKIDDSNDYIQRKLSQISIEKGNEINIDNNDYKKKRLSQINIEKGNELNIDNSDYRKRKSSENYIEHENEITIRKSVDEIKKRKSLNKEIEDKNNEIISLTKQLEDIANKFNNPLLNLKPSDNKLLINKNINQEPNKDKLITTQEELNQKINSLIENKIKKEKDWNNLAINKNEDIKVINEEPQKTENTINKCIEINIDKIYENKNDTQLNDKNEINKVTEFSIDKTIPDTKEELIDTADLIPKEIKITTKKVVKKTDVIRAKFNNTSVAEQSQIKLDGEEKLKPILEEESQDNNRFSVEKTIKEKEKENAIIKEIQVQLEKSKKDDDKDVLRTKIVNLEDLKIDQPTSYSITPDKEKLKENIIKSLEHVKNDELILIPKEMKREIKIVTKKIAKKTNYVYTKFADKKAIVAPQNQFDIKGCQKQESSELAPSQTESIEISNENIQNIDEIVKKYNLHKKPEENVINNKNQFTINATYKAPKVEENVINKNTDFTLDGIHKEPIEMKEQEMQYEINKDDLCEKNTDTSDLIPKEIKLTLKKTVKKTNVIKNKVINSICSETQFTLDGIKQKITQEVPQENVEKIEKETIVENTITKSDWNNCLEKDVQHDNFTIERTQKKEEEKEKDEKSSKLDGDKETNKYEHSTIETTIPVEKIILKEKDWNDSLKVESQQRDFVIERISDNIYDEYNKLKNEKESLKEEKKEEDKNKSRDNADKTEQKEQKEQNVQTIPMEEAIKEKDWNKLLKEDIQQKDFMIEGVKIQAPISDVSEKIESKKEEQVQDKNTITKPININIEGVKEVEKVESKPELSEEKKPQPVIEIQKSNEINLIPAEDLPINKNKIIENWKNNVSEEKADIFNIENQPQKREIKITTKKITKKTNNLYHKFDNLNISSQSQLDIEGKQKMKSSEYSTENSQINVNIEKSYEQKKEKEKEKEKELEIEKNKDIFINANENKKKEIKITTKKKINKVNYVYKRFNNNEVINQSQITLNGEKAKSFSEENLEKMKIDENTFTIDKTLDNAKELEIKEKIIKENEEIKNKLENEKDELKKENDELKTKYENENNELVKEKELLKNKYENENKQLLKENEKLKEQLQN